MCVWGGGGSFLGGGGGRGSGLFSFSLNLSCMQTYDLDLSPFCSPILHFSTSRDLLVFFIGSFVRVCVCVWGGGGGVPG